MARMQPSERRYWREFLELYRELPCLWDVKAKEYCDRNKKNAAYELMIMKLKEKDEAATRESVVKRINIFRSSFRKEHKKVLSSYKYEEVYQPTLWYYDDLKFLLQDGIQDSSVNNYPVSKIVLFISCEVFNEGFIPSMKWTGEK